MGYNFHVGQQVVCVDDRPRPGRAWPDADAPIVGRIYTILDIGPDHCGGPDGIALRFVELTRGPIAKKEHGPLVGYAAFRFRPVKTTSIEIFERMLAPSPQKELEQCD